MDNEKLEILAKEFDRRGARIGDLLERYNFLYEKYRKLQSSHERLKVALEGIMGLTVISDKVNHLNRGIGTATPDGQTLLEAREALKLIPKDQKGGDEAA